MIESALRLKEILARSYIIKDWEAVDIILATVAGHYVPHTEMLWLKLIGPSGSGKTEILRAVSRLTDAYSLEHITPAALRGGYRPVRGKKRVMFLERANGKLVITKEFNIMLTAKTETRNELFGLLRGVYDGSIDSEFDSDEGHLHQESRFDWIVGTTPDLVEKSRQIEVQLGSRTIDLRWRGPDDAGERQRLGDRAVDNDPNLAVIRDEFARGMQSMVDSIRPKGLPAMPYRAQLADFVARYRTPVPRESVSREIMETPDVETPARASQSLARIGAGLSILGIENIQPYIVRLSYDTLPKHRANYVKAIVEGLSGRQEIAEYCGVSLRALDYIREEMRALGFKENDDLSYLLPHRYAQGQLKLTGKGNAMKEVLKKLNDALTKAKSDGNFTALMEAMDIALDVSESRGDYQDTLALLSGIEGCNAEAQEELLKEIKRVQSKIKGE